MEAREKELRVRKAEELSAQRERKAGALRVQALRRLDMDALPDDVMPDWLALVDMVDVFGVRAFDAAVEAIRVVMEKK